MCQKVMCANKVAVVPVDAYDFQDAGVTADRLILVEAIRQKNRQIDTNKIGIRERDFQKMRQQEREPYPGNRREGLKKHFGPLSAY